MVDMYESFEDMNLNEKLLRGIFSYGYEKPSFIQSKAIMPFIQGNDVIAQAQSGTGKTATFSISILEQINPELNETQAIVLSHTRELALQIKTVMTNLANYLNVTINLSVCGTIIKENIE